MASDPAIDTNFKYLYLESLGISEEEKKIVLELASRKDQTIDPVVSCIVGATNGHLYKHLIGNLLKLDKYYSNDFPE